VICWSSTLSHSAYSFVPTSRVLDCMPVSRGKLISAISHD
jgi:hypothetical protein